MSQHVCIVGASIVGLQERPTGGIHTALEEVIDNHAPCVHLVA
ncbi:hypothetical protein [Accumulibacter sp.]|nr:hypothetical protein [Accumulibacter sp.]